MGWTREGACNQCGECCKHVAVFMKRPDEDYCRFAVKQENGTFSCRIKELFDYKNPKCPDSVPVKFFKYWWNECRPYPDPNDPAHVPPRHKLPDKCSFRMVKV